MAQISQILYKFSVFCYEKLRTQVSTSIKRSTNSHASHVLFLHGLLAWSQQAHAKFGVQQIGEIMVRVERETFVLVSQRTSNCCSRRVRCPASWYPRNQGRQWHPGSSTSLNFPNCSLIATVDWSTWTQQKRLPIFCRESIWMNTWLGGLLHKIIDP